MLFLKLINSSFKRNLRVYGPYLMATTMLVVINYIFLAVGANSSLKKLNTGAATNGLIELGFRFILLVTIAFLIYVNRFLWQERRQEMGLYSMLGMTSHNLQWLTVIEKTYLLGISLIAGLAIGIVFEKLAFLGFGYLLKINHLTQPWLVPTAIGKTALLMVLLFALLMIIDLVKLHRLTPSQLWRPQVVNLKRHGRLYTFTGLLGVAFLVGAYYITITIKPRISAIAHFFLAVLFLVIGTYLLFIIGSIVLLQFLQRRKNYYYQPRHFIAVSGMRQRMEQNGASLATICLLCSSILVILFTSVTLYAGIGSTIKSYSPQDVVITSPQDLSSQQTTGIKRTANRYHATVQHRLTYRMTAPHYGYWQGQHFVSQGSINQITNRTSSSVILISAKEYNRITHQHIHLNGNQALAYGNGKGHFGKVTIANRTYHAKKLAHYPSYFNPDHGIYPPTFYVVNQLPTGMSKLFVNSFDYQLNGHSKQRIRFESALQSALQVNNGNFTGKATITSLLSGLYGGLVFIGILISLALGITTTIVIYFKQLSEGYADQERFATMQQVGLSEQETIKSIHSQVLMVFLLPVVGAVINLGFAIPAIRQIMIQLNFYNMPLMMTVGIIITVSLLILYLTIYGLTTRVYRQIVDQPLHNN
ncbi:FtsX-like permease family protein [uncultured Limosilactobacillus sp.]|uniref:ABC transporter permease n=1 Tax=uncultured Limosilactobacillus sp. TaxID=2837629 RepID=UPI0025F98C60|nr:FtsX-like permease family protein [uncultured Limosilactobacillus sp.]